MVALLGVDDAWRRDHSTDNTYSGPIPRMIRLDYNFLYESLTNDHYTAVSYCKHPHGGGHLLLLVQLNTTHLDRTRTYWRFFIKLLKLSDVGIPLSRVIDRA